MIIVELVAAIDAAGTLKTLLIADEGWATRPTDSPANTPALGRLIDPGSLGLALFSDGRTGGATKLQTGEIKIANIDGRLDAWRGYGFDGRPVIIRSGSSSAAYPTGFTTILTATVDGAIEASFEDLVLRLKDKSYVLDTPLLTTRYAGTNSGGTGLEGTANDVKGKVKPRLYGKAFQVEPQPANSTNLIYQVSDRALASVDGVYVAGAALTAGTNYANSTGLAGASVAAGTYATCLAEGLFRLGAAPSGQLTVDATAGATAGDRTVAQILKAIAVDVGVPSTSISSGDVAALDTSVSAQVGIHVTDEKTALAAMDEIAASVGAYVVFDRTGTLRMGRLTAPTGTAVTVISATRPQDIELVPQKDIAIPTWSVKVNYGRLGVVQTSGVAGSVGAPQQAYLAQEYRSVTSSNAAIKTQYLTAGVLEVNTLLVSASDAQTEADRLLALYSTRREQYRVTVDLSVMANANIDFMSPVTFVLDRFGLDAGRLFFVTGYELELADEQAILTLWG